MNNYPIATILGGGGFIGRYLVRKMTEKNFQCIIPTRNAYLKGYLKTQAPPGAIEFIDFNPKDFSKIKEAINNSDIVINLIGILFENRKQKIPTSKLNEVMLAAIEKNPPPALKGKYVKIKYVTQLPTHSPVFAFFCNLPQYVKDPYKRYLENQLRKVFNLKGVPIRVVFKKKGHVGIHQ